MCVDQADKSRLVVVDADLQALGCTRERSLPLAARDSAISKAGM